MILDRESYSPGERVEIQIQVSDKTYTFLDDATVWLKISQPDGTVEDMRLPWNIEQEGVYRGSFEVLQEGVYHLEASATTSSPQNEETILTKRPLSFLVVPSDLEFSNPGMNAALLEQIAETSGGQYFKWHDRNELLEAIHHARKNYTVEMEEDLWDMPLVLILLILFFTIEWISRRRKGLS